MEISIDKIASNLLLILFILYRSQGVLIPVGGIGPFLLLLIFAISLVYLLKIITSIEGLTSFMKVWLVFFLIPVLSFIFTGNFDTDDNIFRQVLINFLPFFPVYYFSKNGILTKKHLIIFLFVLLPILSINFFQSSFSLQVEKGKEDVVSNAIYPIMGLLPFALLIDRKTVSFITINFIWFLAVQSNKRAAIVAGVIALVLFLYQNIYSSSKKNKLQSILVAIIFLLGVTYFAYDFYLQNFYLQERVRLMLEGHSSGRDSLIKELFYVWYHSDSFFDYLFGLGFNSSHYNTASGSVSHNDFIDVLASYGLVGMFAFLALWRNLILEAFDTYWNKSKRISYVLVLMIAVISTMVFRWYDSPFPYMNSILLPYLLATKYKED